MGYISQQYLTLCRNIIRRASKKLKLAYPSVTPLEGHYPWKGCCWKDDYGKYHIQLRLQYKKTKIFIPLDLLRLTICHELAHIGIEEKTDHGPKWQKRYVEIKRLILSRTF